MQIIYANGLFEARFSQDFQGDLDAVKAAGFRTTGPPAWTWYAPPPSIPALNRLRKNRPASGIAINAETFAKYKELAEQFEKNEEIKKAAKKLAKEQKAKVKDEQYTPGEDGDLFDADGNFRPHNLPPMPKSENSFVRPEHPGPWCQFCGDSLYFYELPDICLWCELS